MDEHKEHDEHEAMLDGDTKGGVLSGKTYEDDDEE
jgi:hypothetical protein